MGILEGKVAIVTGAGRGIGREEALLMAKHGAKVVVNDLGSHFDGTGESRSPAEEVVRMIRNAGGEAVANFESVSDFRAAKRICECALDNFGKLNIVVNNAGILRDRMVFNMSEEDFDAVIAVHLKGSFNMARHACAYWREQNKLGNTLNGRIINTSSDSGLLGNVGQSNYGAAKAGLAAMALIIDMEMARYGITANAIAPLARTRMTTDAVAGAQGRSPAQLAQPLASQFDPRDPANVAPVVVWLASDDAKDVHGEVFRTGFGGVWLMQGWHSVAHFTTNEPWDPLTLGARIKEALAQGLTKKESLAELMATGSGN
jgi:NAD(P)-dependent dehydrogenase (short-subunit alcohol dehydrogenase family)